jgi:hypothetical protein
MLSLLSIHALVEVHQCIVGICNASSNLHCNQAHNIRWCIRDRDQFTREMITTLGERNIRKLEIPPNSNDRLDRAPLILRWSQPGTL